MRKLFYLSLIMLICSYISAHASVLEGGISTSKIKDKDFTIKHQILDASTHTPIPYAKVILPKEDFTTFTDANGYFSLKSKINNNSILAISKDGYRPFSITLNKNSNKSPMKVGIEKSKPFDIVLNSNIFHLGDGAYSNTSANSSEFKALSVGSTFSKTFNITKTPASKNIYIVIGSLIGLDTRLAVQMGQSNVKTAYSTPTEVFINGVKIHELHLNGDNLRIKIPQALVRNGKNDVSIKTGRNAMEGLVIDYDDIEFMNLSIQTD